LTQKILLVRWVSRGKTEGHFSEHLEHLEIAASNFDSSRILTLNKDEFGNSLITLVDQLIDFIPNHVHFDWLHDFEDYALTIDSLIAKFNVSWSSVASINHCSRQGHQNEKLNQIMLGLGNSDSLKCLFTWDLWVNDFKPAGYPRFLTIRDYQDQNVSNEFLECCSLRLDSKPIVGTIGQLYGYRGSQKLIAHWLRNRNFRIFLVGRYFANSHTLQTRFIIKCISILNLGFIKKSWIATSERLNHYIKHLDALYIDTKNYPQPSGIAIRARQLGIPLIIEDADSYLRDMSVLDKGIIVGNLHEYDINELKLLIKTAKKFDSPYKFSLEDLVSDLRRGWVFEK
jgi:hypothetical protein